LAIVVRMRKEYDTPGWRLGTSASNLFPAMAASVTLIHWQLMSCFLM